MLENPFPNQIAKGRDIGRLKNPANNFIWLECPECHKYRWVFMRRNQPKSIKCQHCCQSQPKQFSDQHCENIRLAKLGDKNPQKRFMGERNRHWKGGRIKRKDGYIMVYIQPNDFFSSMTDRRNYIMEHRLIMAKQLNRCLLNWETVHHKNGDRADNRIENLELFPQPYKHNGISKMQAYIKRLEQRIITLEQKSDGKISV